VVTGTVLDEAPNDMRSIAQEFYRLAYLERKPEAAARLLDRSLRQHDPRIADGRDAYVGALTELLGTYPFLECSIKRTVADADLVVVHGRLVPEPGDKGRAFVDILRIEGDKIVERWSVEQDVPATSANRNGLF